MRHVLIALALLGLSGLVAAATFAQSGYRIQQGDRLAVQVLEDAGLNSQVLVRPDGRISLPIAGAVRAAGLTPEQLSEVLRERLSPNFRVTPNVTVSLLSVAPPRPPEPEPEPERLTVFVIGEVSRPGALEVPPRTSALQALALAGGPGRFAAENRIQIRTRREDGQELLRVFDYASVAQGAVLSAPILLNDGDIIVVPERRLFE